MLAGTQLTMLVGPTIPLPATRELTESIREIEVQSSADERSGFQIVLAVERSAAALMDYAALIDPRLQPGSRVILTVTLGSRPHVLVDGLITHRQLNPSTEPGQTTIVLTGVDITIAMDREEKIAAHPAQSEAVIVTKIILSYARFGLIPIVVPPAVFDIPIPIDRTPIQRSTDLAYIATLARRFDYVFTVSPGPAPGTNTAYWGPHLRGGPPQRALTVNMGPESNVASLSFQEDAAGASAVAGNVLDRATNRSVQVRSAPASKRLPLALFPTRLNNPIAKLSLYEPTGAATVATAQAEAQSQADATTDSVTGSGEVDVARYGDMLRPRKLVGVRGVGLRYDGLYEVRSTTTKIAQGSITQSFEIVREGVGSTVPVVLV